MKNAHILFHDVEGVNLATRQLKMLHVRTQHVKYGRNVSNEAAYLYGIHIYLTSLTSVSVCLYESYLRKRTTIILTTTAVKNWKPRNRRNSI
jgi:hypothetical protein